MTQTLDCGEARVSLGVYVLGAIDPAERARVESHLGTCRDCRDELAGLAGIPALLARMNTEEAIALAEDAPPGEEPGDGPGKSEEQAGERGAESEPPKELLGTVLELTAARRRRRQWRTAGLSAAAAAIIAAGAFGGARLAAGHGGNFPSSPAASLGYGVPQSAWTTAHGASGGMYATVEFERMGWGTQVNAKVVGIPVGTYCTLAVVGKDGSRTVIGGWTTDTAEGTVWYPASTGLPAGQVSEFQITVGHHQAIAIPVQ